MSKMIKGLLLSMLAMLVLAACQPTVVTETVEVPVTRIQEVVVEKDGEQVVVTQVVQEVVVVTATPDPAMDKKGPVTLNINWSSEPPTLDPSLATDSTSVNIVGNLFVGLTKFHPVTGEITPSLAKDWTVNDDGSVYTFNLRNDIAWVNYNPVTGEAVQAMDADGNPRFVNAYDVEYGVKRTIDPKTASDYSYVLYIIKNAADVNGGSEELTLDDVGVKALDEWTVEFTLDHPAGYFPAIAGMWVAYPMPSWTIEEWGDRWTEAGVITTNGPYALDTWVHGGQLNMAKNPLWVNAADVQIEYISGVMIQESATDFAMYENNELDTTGVPSTEIDRVKSDSMLSAELRIAPVPCTYYYGFTNNKPPFDDVRVRRAFSASIDRQSLIDNVTKGNQIAATSFAPPGMFGAPEPGTVGLGYDPDMAVAELQSYLDEKGLSLEEFNELGVTLMHNTSDGHARIAAAIQQMWKDVLGAEVRLENQEWAVYLDTIKATTPIEEVPHMYRLGWCADYPDENNWVHEVFNSTEGANRLRRNCADPNCGEVGTSEFDELTKAAGIEQDPAKRAEMYAKAEQMLAYDEAAYAPIYHYTSVAVTKPWLTRNFPPLGASDYYNWTIDVAAKDAATGN